jgi:hypothetical protein
MSVEILLFYFYLAKQQKINKKKSCNTYISPILFDIFSTIVSNQNKKKKEKPYTKNK